jgi:hypothetical protein
MLDFHADIPKGENHMQRQWRRSLVALSAVSVIAGTTVIATQSIAEPDPRATATTAAERHGWGDEIPEGSDEFNYGSEQEPAVPDEAKWDLVGDAVGQCIPGHDSNGQRCEEKSRVVGQVLRQTGEANGDTAWLGSNFSQQYGRWEARVRSMPNGDNNDRQYHPLLIIWPDSDRWPEDGEYDFLENEAPGQDCAESWIHYPHNPDVDTQQEFSQKCGVDLTQWHNIGFEWTADGVKGFIDGEEWFSFSGGENGDRQCIQCMPSGHLTIQLDNFYGEDLQPATYEIDWVHTYAVT